MCPSNKEAQMMSKSLPTDAQLNRQLIGNHLRLLTGIILEHVARLFQMSTRIELQLEICVQPSAYQHREVSFLLNIY